MGLHSLCDNPYHHFDRNFDVEMIYDKEKQDYLLVGICKECQTMRAVYESVLKDPAVIRYKMKGRY